MLKALSMTFSDSRIQDEGQKDGEKNIPEMGSYQPAPFEQVLIANGERRAQQAYQKASARIAKHKPCSRPTKTIGMTWKPESPG